MATRNPFALLAAEEDGVIKKIAQTKPSAPAQPAKAAAPAAQAKTAPAAAAPAKSAAPQQQTKAAPAAAASGSAPAADGSQKPRDSRPRSDRPPRAEGERAPRPPRAEGDKPAGAGGERPPRGPRPEGDRPPRPPRAEGERPPRPPRAEGDKPAGAEGERPPRAPRAEGDRPPRPPRAEGERPPRAPRAEGDRPPRQPRAEGAEGAPRQRYNKDDPNPRGKRNFDRRSGDHKVLAESSRGGAGAHSWGVLGEEGTKEPKHLSKNETVDGSSPTVDPVAEDASTPAAPEVEEPKVFTLEEIMKMKKEKAVSVEKKIRKAGEGVDEAWTDAVLVNRVELPEYLPKKEEEKAKEAKKDTKPAPTKAAAVRADDLIKIVVPERPRDSDSRERRPRNFDGPRQERPRGGPKGGKAAAPAAPALDESAFPSLKTAAKPAPAK